MSKPMKLAGHLNMKATSVAQAFCPSLQAAEVKAIIIDVVKKTDHKAIELMKANDITGRLHECDTQEQVEQVLKTSPIISPEVLEAVALETDKHNLHIIGAAFVATQALLTIQKSMAEYNGEQYMMKIKEIIALQSIKPKIIA